MLMPESAEKPLFETFVSDPPAARTFLAMRYSVVVHVVVAVLIILVPIFWPSPSPEHPDYIRVLIYNPPPPPPLPLPRGSALVDKAKPSKTVTPERKPEKPEFTAPDEHPKEAELKPEARAPETEQAGSETGSEAGVPEGMEGGQEDGQIGGVLGGTPGGVIGGTGDEVADYDQPPRLVRAVKPVYPQEAFIKKIEGLVVVGCSIGPDGRVRRAWLISSTAPALNRAALEAVLQWSFAPALKHGRPVATVINAPVSFRIF